MSDANCHVLPGQRWHIAYPCRRDAFWSISCRPSRRSLDELCDNTLYL